MNVLYELKFGQLFYNTWNQMGNNGNKQDRVVPPSGFRVISITRNSVGEQIGTAFLTFRSIE